MPSRRQVRIVRTGRRTDRVAATEGEEPEVDLDTALTAAVAPLTAGADGVRVSVAVLDTGSGARAVHGDGSFDTASVVKVDLVAALLLIAQDEGRALTAVERERAAAVIERSDNARTTVLLREIGGPAALDAANARLGLTGTTAADRLTLLRAVFGTESELNEESRAYLRGLMERVEAGQRWGVSAAGDRWALKNGWMPRTTTGLWDINSIGRVRADGRTCLVAVLSDGQPTKESGIALVEAVAKAAVGVVGRAR
ncbi:serine hydrolase [Streptomyces sp. NPDC088394]|uniref:serine hydrolase n=1 Tax=Streptomyces sp. NPDC088394 TaxID=3365860 RepID=UPI0037FB1E4D